MSLQVIDDKSNVPYSISIETTIDNNFITIINDYNQLFNLLYEINSKNLIYTNRYNIPISNKYWITLIDKDNGQFGDFFKYIFDDKREIEPNFTPLTNTDMNLKWDKEQFYFIELYKSNISILENELDEVNEIINDSNASSILLIDINYLINFLIDCKEKQIPVQIYDYLLFKLKKFNLDQIIIFDEDNKYSKTNLLYKQIDCLLNKTKKFIQILSEDSEEIYVYKNLDDNELNIYWKISNPDDLIIKKKIVETNFNSNIKFYYGNINHVESFISKIRISEIINKNIFELENDPGIIIDPIDKINCVL